jgi:hypothetical protein
MNRIVCTQTWCAMPALGLLLALPAAAQNQNPGATAGAAGQTAGQVAGQVGNAVGQAGNAAGNVVGQAGQAAGNVVGGLQPTLQPIGEGVGGALNNLTQPQNINSLLEFLSSVIPNHIEAHVNLDALRVDKLTVDVRGVDLRNLRVDLLVANSRGGQARPAMTMGNNSAMGSGSTTGSATGTTNNNGQFIWPSGTPSRLNLNNTPNANTTAPGSSAGTPTQGNR